MDNDGTAGGQCLRPSVVYSPDNVSEAHHLIRFRKFVQQKYGIPIADFWELQEWSVEHFPEFWECVWIYFDVIHSEPYTEVFDRRRGFSDMQWFRGAKLNFAENVFRFRDSHTALIVTDEYDNLEYVTYEQMYEEVKVYATSLKAIGLNRGDRVACFMSNRKEAIFAFLATTFIGAVWSGTHPLLGAKAVVSRFELINPKVLFTVANTPFNGTQLDMMPKLTDIAHGLPTLKKIVIVPSKHRSSPESMRKIPKSCRLSEFLCLADSSNSSTTLLEFEQVPFDHPLSISYTSGTTGKPKALLHSTGAFFASLKDFGLHQSCERDDIMLAVSPVGWISWTMFVNTLHLGLTLCVYEGNPYNKSPTYYWDLVEKHGITTILAASSSIEELQVKGYRPTPNHNLKSLKRMFGAGSPVKPQSFEFMANCVKPGLFCGSLYGSTETLGMCCGVDSTMPVYKGELQCFSLGIGVRCINEGACVVGERGDLVLANPMPCLPMYLEHDENKEKMTEIYLNRHPGFWDQKDECWINPVTKGFKVFGRSDETMNPKGARFSSSEIYFALDVDILQDIADSVCVSFFTPQQDEKIVLFVKMSSGCEFNSDVDKRIRKIIAEDLSVEHLPDIILQTPDIPYNVTGKKMDILVKNLINKKQSNAECLRNPTSVEFFKDIQKKLLF